MIRLRVGPEMTRAHAWAAVSVLGFFLVGFIFTVGFGAILDSRLMPLAGLGGGVMAGTLRGLCLRRQP
jgi:hypothetical protein